MIEYCCGFLFANNRYVGKCVLLIEKRRPKWQAGKLNGIGGHVEPGETPHQAQVREFEEEAGLRIEQWSPVAVLTGDGFRVHFFAAHTDEETLKSTRSVTDEMVISVKVEEIANLPVLPNLRVIIPLALDTSGIVKPVHLWDAIRQAA